MKFMQDTKKNLHGEMVLLWAVIMWIWFQVFPEEGVMSIGGGVVILVMVFRHAFILLRAED